MSTHNLISEIIELFKGSQTSKECEQELHELLTKQLRKTAESTPNLNTLLEEIIDLGVGDSMVFVNAKAVLLQVVKVLAENKIEYPSEVRKQALLYLLEKTHQRISIYDEVITEARKHLSEIYKEEGEWNLAAKQLEKIPHEYLQRSTSDEERFDIYVDIVGMFLNGLSEADAAVALNRASTLLPKIKDANLVLNYRSCQARIFDSLHKFVDAANIYLSISQSTHVPKPLRMEIMEAAINCSVLAAAGPQRMRVLSKIYNDKVAQTVDTYPVVEKMYLKRLIKTQDVAVIDKKLAPHQRKYLADKKTTLLTRAVREHNLFVLSSLYKNLRFSNLGKVLGVSAEEAEGICAVMITEGRMKGRIDQIEGLIKFEGAREVKDVVAAISLNKNVSESQPPPMYLRETVANKWNQRIVGLCQTIEDSIDTLIERHPAYSRELFRRVN